MKHPANLPPCDPAPAGSIADETCKLLRVLFTLVRKQCSYDPARALGAWRAELEGAVSGDPEEERYQGGAYCSIGYSRPGPSPRDPFAPG